MSAVNEPIEQKTQLTLTDDDIDHEIIAFSGSEVVADTAS